MQKVLNNLLILLSSLFPQMKRDVMKLFGLSDSFGVNLHNVHVSVREWRISYAEVVWERAGLDHSLVEDGVVVFAEQDVVPDRGVLDPRLLRRQAEASVSVYHEQHAAQPAETRQSPAVSHRL